MMTDLRSFDCYLAGLWHKAIFKYSINIRSEPEIVES
jgi:hypothetical protein